MTPRPVHSIHLPCSLLALALLAGPASASSEGTVVARDAIQPRLAIAAEGALYVAYLRAGNVEVARSEDGGTSFESVVALDADGQARGGLQRGPRIAVDATGVVHLTAALCFDAAELMRPYPRNELWYTRSSDGGRSWSPRVRVNEIEKCAGESLHTLSVDARGTAHVAWLDNRDGEGQSIYYASVEDGEVSANRLALAGACECCAPGLAVDAKGSLWLAYREGRAAKERGTYLVRSRDAGQSWGDPKRLNKSPSNVFG